MWKLKRDSHNPFLKERKERCGGGEVGETDNKQDRKGWGVALQLETKRD